MRNVGLIALLFLAGFIESDRRPRLEPRQIVSPARVSCTFIRGPKDEADPQPFLFRIQRAGGDARKPLVVRILMGGTMTAGEDYVAPPPSIVIPADALEVILSIQGLDDDIAEGRETLEVSAGL